MYSDLQHNISLVLEQTKRISICCDIWSKQGMTASFLGVIVHCFTVHDRKRHSITLAVKRFEQPHTGERIAELLQSILDQWDIPRHKVFCSLTDNGSNMIKAFKLLSFDETDEEESSEVLSENELDSEQEDDCDDSDLEDEEMSDGSAKAVDEIKNFDEHEDDHSIAFIGWKRNSCFTHTLQLVVKEFEKAPCFKATLAKAYKIVKKFNSSCKGTEKLVKLAGKKLVSNCPTRWDSIFLMISRLISVRDHVTTVLDDLGWDALTPSQWKQLRAVVELLQPFAHQTNVASSENTTSIPMVIPSLKELDLHLKEVRN